MAFVIYFYGILYPTESVLDTIHSSLFIDIIWIIVGFGIAFVVTAAFSSLFLVIYEIIEGDIFGRILSSTYVASIYMEYYFLIRYINGGELRGLFSRWSKNIHELLALHIAAVFLYLPFLLLIIGAYVDYIIYSNISIDLPITTFLDAILWTIGLLLAVLFFFFRYITEQLEYRGVTRHFPYLLVSLIGFSISIIYTVVFATYPTNLEENVLNAAILAYFSMSLLFLFIVVTRIIWISFTNGMRKIQKRAAKRDIFKQAPNEARIEIARRIVKKESTDFEECNT